MVRQLSILLDIDLRRPMAVLHDPETYPDPEEFNPERFLNEDGTFRSDPDSLISIWSWQEDLSWTSLCLCDTFQCCRSVLSAFSVTKAKDMNGNEIPIKAAVTSFILLSLFC